MPFLSKSRNPHLDLHVSVRQHHEEVIVGHPILFPQLTDELLVHKIFILYHFHGLFIILMWDKGEIKIVMDGITQHSAFNFTLKERGKSICQNPSSCPMGKLLKKYQYGTMAFNCPVFSPLIFWKSVYPRAHALQYSTFLLLKNLGWLLFPGKIFRIFSICLYMYMHVLIISPAPEMQLLLE